MSAKSPDPGLDGLTYPHLNLHDHTLDENLPDLPQGKECPSLLPTSQPPIFLDRLPPELLQDILSQLDLQTLTDFRRVNKRALELAASLPQYRAIHKHARNALHGILKIETGRCITCRDLYEKLCSPGCEHCGDFAGHLYLLTCWRVCFLCFSEREMYLPLPFRRANRKFGINNRVMRDLPNMRAVPGIYSPNEKKIATSMALVDYEAALAAGVALHGSMAGMERYVRERGQADKSDPFDGKSGNPFRFAAIVRLPWLNRATQTMESGFHCRACQRSTRPPLHFRRKFTHVSFVEHLRTSGIHGCDDELSRDSDQ